MIACFDAGNTRLKWGLADRSETTGWQACGALEWSRLDELPALAASWPTPEKIFLTSVADTGTEKALIGTLSAAFPSASLTRIVATASAGGVRNGYAEAGRLGADRWCALIGARALEKRACLVVTAGTATTVDSLDASGRFLGGMILPGIEMMKNALVQGTARLLPASGQYADFPLDTHTAIITGCLEAQAGAIERAFRRLPEAACCFLSGGAAPDIAPLLDLPLRRVPCLALEGIRHLALAGR
jgi:type III pantothenate kinase